MDDIHDEEVACFPLAILRDHNSQIVGMTWLHWVAAEVVDQTLDGEILPA
jgi:hypothetical protein